MNLPLLVAILMALFVAPLPLLAQTQSEMNQQAFNDFTAADKKLNAAYAKAMKAMEDDEAREKLKASQRAWVAYRDAQAELEADSSRGGSIQPLELASAKTELTKARTAFLKTLYEE